MLDHPIEPVGVIRFESGRLCAVGAGQTGSPAPNSTTTAPPSRVARSQCRLPRGSEPRCTIGRVASHRPLGQLCSRRRVGCLGRRGPHAAARSSAGATFGHVRRRASHDDEAFLEAQRGAFDQVLPVPGRWAVHTPSSQLQRGTCLRVPAAESGRGFGGGRKAQRTGPRAASPARPAPVRAAEDGAARTLLTLDLRRRAAARTSKDIPIRPHLGCHIWVRGPAAGRRAPHGR